MKCLTLRFMPTALALVAIGFFAQGAPPQTLVSGFEKDVEGFRGPCARDEAVAKSGTASLRVAVDLRSGGSVTISKRFCDLDHDITAIRFWVKSNEVSSITFRLVDRTGQAHQQRPAFPDDGKWHLIELKSFDSGPVYESWGGASDGKWHGPPRSLDIDVDFGWVKNNNGTLWIDDFRLTLAKDRFVPDLEVRPETLGNVFHPDEDVRLRVKTRGDEIAWKTTDFWDAPAAEGREKVVDDIARIRPGRRPGYFWVSLESRKDGKKLADGETTYAVIPRFEPRNRDASPFGVVSHFSQGWETDVLELFSKAGLSSIRDEHPWEMVERDRGVYEFPDDLRRYMAEAQRFGLRPLIPMTFENPLHDGGQTPHTPAGYAAYARYGEAILKEFGPQVKWLEIWNEYNGSFCKGPATKDRPKHYAQMLQVAHQRIKEVRPDVEVLGGGVVSIPLPYLEEVFKHGGIRHMDAVVIHPYCGRPEGVEHEVAELEALIRKYNEGQDKPIWATETGWVALGEVDRRTSARYLVREYALLLTRNVKKIYWYLGRDYLEFEGMGLVRRPDSPLGRYAPAPAYVAYATFIRLLDGSTFVRREAVRPYTQARVYLFQRGEEEIRVCWSTQPTEIDFVGAAPTRVDLMGEERRVEGTRVALDETPFYLVGKLRDVVEIPPKERVLADSIEDYSKEQGRRNWSYGYSTPELRFKEMNLGSNDYGVFWRGPADSLMLAVGQGHPSAIDGRSAWAVQRWTSPVASKVRLAGAFSRGKEGDGSGGKILVDGVQVYETWVGGKKPPRETFDVTLDVKKGSTIDFAITPGPGLDLNYDATNFEARISEVGS
jgi:hypothetical protein